MNENKFMFHLTSELIKSINNNFKDNYDEYRYGKEILNLKSKTSIKSFLVSMLRKFGYYNNFNNQIFANKIADLDFPLLDFKYLYNQLENQISKDLLIKIVAYRILGHEKVKLPLNTPDFWRNQNYIEPYQSKTDIYSIDFMNWKFPLTNLDVVGFPIKLYGSAPGVNSIFIIKQYELLQENLKIEVKEGDIVIDCGGCFGDTALYFAEKSGVNGKVHVFEFINDNILLLNKNLSLNPELERRIQLIEKPLWNESGNKLYYLPNGPGSFVSEKTFEGYTHEVTTISIDDYIENYKITRVDFIKMDIEGAEIKCLEGAIKVIKEFKPKLAIALYHSTIDFDRIPRFIKNLDLGYKLYLSHSTIYDEETMLFAISES